MKETFGKILFAAGLMYVAGVVGGVIGFAVAGVLLYRHMK